VDLGLLGFAFAAGALATVNPCGFVMLPALVGLRLQRTDQATGSGTVLRDGLAFGLQATAGFLAIFLVHGSALALGARFLIGLFPLGAIAVGLALIGAGAYGLLTGRAIVTVPTTTRALDSRVPGAAAFGAAYAVASLSCTLPLFLAVVGGTLASEGIAGAVLPFVGYAAGMGAVLLAVTLAVGMSAGVVVRGLRRIMPIVERLGSVILIGAGLYLVVYWLPQVR
jgi:cytochrome c-type biogenesis protein